MQYAQNSSKMSLVRIFELHHYSLYMTQIYENETMSIGIL